MPQDHDIAADRDALLAASALALLAMLAVPPLFGFALDLASFYPVAVLASVPTLFLPYARWRGLHRLAAGLETTALGLVLAVPALVFSYAAMRVGAPLADGTLRAWDAALGFDWLACVRFVDRSRSVAAALSIGYSSFVFQLLLLPALLCAARLPERAYRLMLGYLLLCTLSAIIGAGFPAEAAYVAYDLPADAFRHVDGHFGRLFLDSFHAARTAEHFTLGLGDAAGIVTFPSVHAGVAALCAWAAWPSRPLRALFVPLNLLMAASAVTNGAHYLVDVLAGGAVAFLTIALVRRAGRVAARPRLAAEPRRLTQIA